MPAQHKFNKVWRFPGEITLPGDYCRDLALPEMVLQTLFRRGIQTTESARAFLDEAHYSPSSPFEFADMQKSIIRTLDAIQKKETIGVWGDFDVDGQTSTAVLVSTLRKCGARVVYHVPVRGPESHGIQVETLKTFLAQGVNLLITCDTGISETESIAYAQSRHVDVIVTDHHSLPPDLPGAFALVNPQFLPAGHPLRSLPGVGTAYKFAEALLDASNHSDFSKILLDLAAIGIIADIATLRGDARYLVQAGFRTIRESPRPSISALLKAAEIQPSQFNEETVSFAVAPRLNAVGRLADANPLVEFLLMDDPAEIAVTVNQLEGLNARRKLLCDLVFEGALAQIERDPRLLDHPVLILTHPEWHAGVVGITASRLVEMFGRPVILLTAPPGALMKGSARSITGIDIIAAIRQQSNTIVSCGGHPMAAGLSLKAENFSAFQRGLDQTLLTVLSTAKVESILEIDASLSPQQVDLDLLSAIEKMAPFGEGNPALTFAASNLHLTDTMPFGKTRDHLRLDVEDEQGRPARFIWWQGAGMPMPDGIFDLAFTARSSTYRGELQVQLEWVDFKSSNSAIQSETRSRVKIPDFVNLRDTPDPDQMLAILVREKAPFVFAEGRSAPGVNGCSRLECAPNPNLVIWHLPPSPDVFTLLIDKVQPSTLHFFGVLPEENNTAILLKSVSQGIKKQLTAGEPRISVEVLAAQTAASTAVVIQILRWLEARGDIRIESETQDTVTIHAGGVANPAQESKLRQELQRLIEEIQAYRNFLLRSGPKIFLNPK